MPEVTLCGVCNRTLSTAEELAQQYSIENVYTDFEKMLDDAKPDLVDIITPPVTHMAYVNAAIDRNIPVICQKPFTPSFAEASELMARLKRRRQK